MSIIHIEFKGVDAMKYPSTLETKGKEALHTHADPRKINFGGGLWWRRSNLHFDYYSQ